jgi:predicted AlkP superfamily pyrophosphatase or phosphodiesterase
VYEADGINITFPHNYEKELAEEIPRNKDVINTWFAWTPVADAATLAFAKTGIKALLLGQRESTDYLSIVLSQIDNVCHYYGANSLEALDAFFRLDKELQNFFTFLDVTVGIDNYILALSSDHGFPDISEYRQEEGMKSKRVIESEIEELLSEVEKNIGDSSVFSDSVSSVVVESLKKYDFIADAYLPKDLFSKDYTKDDFLRLYRNSCRKDRIPRLPLFSLNTFESIVGKTGVMMRLTEGSMINLDVVIHGSPYTYDRHVPIYFLGAGVSSWVSLEKVATTDVAPTLAELAGIKFPGNTDGRSLIKTKN